MSLDLSVWGFRCVSEKLSITLLMETQPLMETAISLKLATLDFPKGKRQFSTGRHLIVEPIDLLLRIASSAEATVRAFAHPT